MQTHTSDPRDARLNVRVSGRIKHQAEEAAALLGQSLTDFTESALSDKAQSVLERHERITVSSRDFAAFVTAIERPERPTPALREAMADYRRLYSDSSEPGR